MSERQWLGDLIEIDWEQLISCLVWADHTRCAHNRWLKAPLGLMSLRSWRTWGIYLFIYDFSDADARCCRRQAESQLRYAAICRFQCNHSIWDRWEEKPEGVKRTKEKKERLSSQRLDSCRQMLRNFLLAGHAAQTPEETKPQHGSKSFFFFF